MALVLISYAPSRQAYESLTADVGDGPAAGCIVHTASELDDGRVRIVDVWESQEAMQAFFQKELGPAFQKAGIQPEQPDVCETFHIERG